MRRLEAQPLDGFNETLIDQPATFAFTTHDNRQLDYQSVIGNTPVITSSYDGMHDAQLTLATNRGLEHWDDEAHFRVGRMDKIHGRNVEILAGKVALSDQFGNEYTSICIKGGDMSDPHFFTNTAAERGYMIHGLQESLVMERVLLASKVLRSAGVATEYICGLTLPEYFPLNVKTELGIDDKTLHELSDFLERLAGEYAQNPDNIPEGKMPLEVKAELIDTFKDCDYLLSYRAMDSPYRFGEIYDDQKFSAFKKFIRSNHDGPGLDEYLDRLGQSYYIVGDFAPALGANIAKMHNAGITHGQLHSTNISAFGSILDLDSCKGEPLSFGQPVNVANQYVRASGDVLRALLSLDTVISKIKYDGVSPVESYLYYQESSYYASTMLLQAYLETRSTDKEVQKQTLATILLHASERTRQSNGVAFDMTAQRIYAAYRVINIGQETPAAGELPAFNPEQSVPVRSTSFLSAVPSRFFADKAQGLIDGSWTMNDEHPDLDLEKYGSLNPAVKLACRDIALRLYTRYLFDNDYLEKPDDLMFAIEATLERPSLKPQLTDSIKTDFDQVFERVITAFSQPETPPKNAYLGDFIAKNLPSYLDRVGWMLITDDYEFAAEGPLSPVFYLDQDQDFKAVLDILQINDCTDIEFVSIHDIKLDADNLAGTVVLCDYKTAQKASDESNLPGIINTVIRRRHDFRPPVIISGTLTDSPKVQVLILGEDESSEPLTYQDLLETVCPSQTTVRQLTLPINEAVQASS